MRRKGFNAKEHIQGLNALREALVEPISSKEMRKRLGECGLPTNTLFWSKFVASDLCVKISLNQYTISRTPIHYGQLQALYNEYIGCVNQYALKYRGKKQLKEDLKKGSQVRRAIDFLKSKGFVILAPVGSEWSRL